MQIFIKRSDLALGADKVVSIIASYDDGIKVDPKWHGNDATVLSVPASAIDMTTPPGALRVGWRNDNKQQIMSAEASRRINETFPDYSQRNAIAEIESYILQYGADSGKWPDSAKQRKVEFDRCWNYVRAVRTASTQLAQRPPADPNADSNWPTRIAPYKTS